MMNAGWDLATLGGIMKRTNSQPKLVSDNAASMKRCSSQPKMNASFSVNSNHYHNNSSDMMKRTSSQSKLEGSMRSFL